LLPAAKAQGFLPQLSNERPLWSVRSKQIGYTPSEFNKFIPTVGGGRVKSLFLDNDRVAVAWLTPDKPESKLIGYLTPVPSHLHLVIVDAHTGGVILRHEWACSSVGVNLAYTPSGNWLVASGHSVSLYSRSFEVDKVLQSVSTRWASTALVSPSDQTFLTFASGFGDELTGQLRDAATFRIRDSWNDKWTAHASIVFSDHYILAQAFEAGTGAKTYLRRVGGNWNPYPLAGYKVAQGMPAVIGFVNDEVVAILPPHELIVKNIRGNELFSLKSPKTNLFAYSWSNSATSWGGQRFAVILGHLRGLRIETLDMYPFLSDDRVVVYSLSEKKAIFSVKVKGLSPWPQWGWSSHPVWNRIVLSPNGLLLAISSDQGLKIYSLPADGQQSH
jgi:hypothetical protein